jgi:hypothetical protein
MLPLSSSATQSAEAYHAPIDALVCETAQRIPDVISCFEPEFDKRHGSWLISAGSFEFGLQAHMYKPVLVPGKPAGHDHPITVHAHATCKPHTPTSDAITNPST